MSQLRVLVVGASVAGPSAAYWFAKAGASVTIIERFPELRTSGQAIDIRTAGVTVMRKIHGMESAVRARSTTLEGASFIREDGTPFGTLRSTGNPDQQSIISEYEIFRGDLAKILFDLTKDNDNIKYIFGEQAASLQQAEQGDGPLTVEFANGSPTSEYDLVVAYDGSHSRTRAMGLTCNVRDYLKSTNCWAAYFSIKEDLLQGSKIEQAYSVPKGRTVIIGPNPAGVTRVTLMYVNPRDDSDTTLPFREAMKKGDGTLKQFVAKHYKNIGWKTNDILSAMIESKDFYASEIVRVKPPSLYNGRFILVNNTSYAPGFTNNSTTLAITGAYILASEVCEHKNDLTAGLEGYEKQMRPIITDLQQVPPLIPTILRPQTAWGIAMRNYLFAFITWTRILELIQKYFGAAFASSDKYKLKDYAWVA